MAKTAAGSKAAMDTEEYFKGVLSEWQSIRDELRQRYTWNLQTVGFVVAALVAILAYGVPATATADGDSARWLTVGASISGFAVLIVGIVFTIANFQSIARNATYARLFLEEEHPGLNWETHLHQFRTLSGEQLGQTGVVGMMYLTMGMVLLAASLLGLVRHEAWYVFPLPATMFAVLLYFVRDMSCRASKRWDPEKYWREIKQSSAKGAGQHA